MAKRGRPERGGGGWARPWHGLSSVTDHTPWALPAKWNMEATKWSAWIGRDWVEVFVRVPPAKFSRLVRVERAGVLKLHNDTERRRLFMGVFDRLPGDGRSGEPERVPDDPIFVKTCPTVWTYLTAVEYEPGKPRERSSLSVRIEGGCCKLWLSEPVRNAGLEATGETFSAALKALESRLTSAAPGWRLLAPRKGGKRS